MPDRIQRLRRRLFRLYAVAALVSVLLGSIFFLFGLDLTYVQVRIVFGYTVPLAVIPMFLADRWAIGVQLRPLHAFFDALPDEGAEPTEATRRLAGPALVRALNLPFLSALRVMVA